MNQRGLAIDGKGQVLSKRDSTRVILLFRRGTHNCEHRGPIQHAPSTNRIHTTTTRSSEDREVVKNEPGIGARSALIQHETRFGSLHLC